MGYENSPKTTETIHSLKRRLTQLQHYEEVDYDEIFFDLVSMGILTINDVDKFWNFPAPYLLPFYQKVKIKYYQRINEQSIGVARLNVSILAIANSFGKEKFNAEQTFKESLPFNPDVLEVTENDLEPETINILKYYVKNKMIPDIIIEVMDKDPDFREILRNTLRSK